MGGAFFPPFFAESLEKTVGRGPVPRRFIACSRRPTGGRPTKKRETNSATVRICLTFFDCKRQNAGRGKPLPYVGAMHIRPGSA